VSEENVEIVVRQFELWNAGDLDAAMDDYAPDVVVESPEGWPEGSVSRGVDEWQRQAQRLRDTWDEARADIEEILPVGDDRVVARFRYVTSGKDSGLSFNTPIAALFFLRERKITRVRYFWDVAEAREAAGLPG